MENKKTFIRYISHEIRSPLSTTSLGLDYLIEQLGAKKMLSLRAGHEHAERPADVRQDRDGHAGGVDGGVRCVGVRQQLREAFPAAGGHLRHRAVYKLGGGRDVERVRGTGSGVAAAGGVRRQRRRGEDR